MAYFKVYRQSSIESALGGCSQLSRDGFHITFSPVNLPGYVQIDSVGEDSDSGVIRYDLVGAYGRAHAYLGTLGLEPEYVNGKAFREFLEDA